MVFLDTGTTVLALAGLLIPRKDLVIATNSLPVLSLARSDGAHVIALGGDVRIPSQSLCGAAALEWVGRLHFDLAVMGASGLDPKDGASITSLEECAMKQGAMERADRVLLLADRGKWRHPAGIVFAPWDRFDCWVTDAQLDVGDAAGLAAPRLRVVKV
jgi:DeoR/GlpR family transcriptional regulator of sugar metabolism